MKKLLLVSLTLLLAFSTAAARQNSNSSMTNKSGNVNTAKKRGPVFRASKDQIKQAQTILKQRNFYGGEANGTLDTDTRTGLKKYQEAEKIKVTGTLNALTLEKMGIALTDKQKEMAKSKM